MDKLRELDKVNSQHICLGPRGGDYRIKDGAAADCPRCRHTLYPTEQWSLAARERVDRFPDPVLGTASD